MSAAMVAEEMMEMCVRLVVKSVMNTRTIKAPDFERNPVLF